MMTPFYFSTNFKTLPPLSLRITPAGGTLLLGQSRELTVVDQFGRPRVDAAWTHSDANVATLSQDSGRATLTAAGPGQTTATATVGSVTASTIITVTALTALPAGTVRWAAGPAPAGMTSRGVLLPVSRPDGPDLYVLNGSTTQTHIQALTYDGQQLWEAVGPAASSRMPDAYGGMFVVANNGCDHINRMTLVNIDRFGQEAWQYVGQSACTVDPPNLALRYDGSVVVSTPGNTSGFPPVMVLDGRTGQVLVAPAIPPSRFTDFSGQTFDGYSRIGPAMVDAAGVVNVAYEKREVAYPPRVVSSELWLLRIGGNNQDAHTMVASTTLDENLFPGRIIPDGDGGVIVTWTVTPSQGSPAARPFKMAHVDATGAVTVLDIPLDVTAPLDLEASGVPKMPEFVLGQGGVVHAAYRTTATAFAIATATQAWTHAGTGPVSLVSSEDTGNIVVKETDAQGTDIVRRLDGAGQVVESPLVGTGLEHVTHDDWVSASESQVYQVVGPKVSPSDRGWPTPMMKRFYQAAPDVWVPEVSTAEPKLAVVRNAVTTAS
jgi:hypothetical protein